MWYAFLEGRYTVHACFLSVETALMFSNLYIQTSAVCPIPDEQDFPQTSGRSLQQPRELTPRSTLSCCIPERLLYCTTDPIGQEVHNIRLDVLVVGNTMRRVRVNDNPCVFIPTHGIDVLRSCRYF